MTDLRGFSVEELRGATEDEMGDDPRLTEKHSVLVLRYMGMEYLLFLPPDTVLDCGLKKYLLNPNGILEDA